MRWFRIPVAYVRTLIATFKYPEHMSIKQRQKAIELIMKLAKLYGLDTSVSDRCHLSPESISQVAQARGVYRIYEETELQYIGASGTDIQWRLKRHYYESRNIHKARNKGLADLIASGRASLEWYVCPFAGWMEEYELTEYCQKHGRQPALNSHRRSGLINRSCW